jgi:hypothetical protein
MRDSPIPTAGQAPDADFSHTARNPEDVKTLEAVEAHLTPEGADSIRALRPWYVKYESGNDCTCSLIGATQNQECLAFV